VMNAREQDSAMSRMTTGSKIVAISFTSP